MTNKMKKEKKNGAHKFVRRGDVFRVYVLWKSVHEIFFACLLSLSLWWKLKLLLLSCHPLPLSLDTCSSLKSVKPKVGKRITVQGNVRNFSLETEAANFVRPTSKYQQPWEIKIRTHHYKWQLPLDSVIWSIENNDLTLLSNRKIVLKDYFDTLTTKLVQNGSGTVKVKSYFCIAESPTYLHCISCNTCCSINLKCM